MAVKQRFPWVGVSAVVAILVVFIAGGLQLPDGGQSQHASGALPSLNLARIDPVLSEDLLAEQIAAYDPAPLFVPSPMNSNEPALPDEVRPGAGGPFASLPPELTKTAPITFPSPVLVPKNPVDGLRLTERFDVPLALARGDTRLDPLKERLGQVEAVDAASGRVTLVLDLPLPDDLPEGDWQPLELMGAVTRAGLAGDLVVTSSSGSAEIDDYFRSHLKKSVRIGERLSQGFYAFRVGP